MNVVVALISDARQRLLITQRALHISSGGLWEFPGGKIELNETPIEALKREIREEVGLEIIEACYLGEVKHHYADRYVCLCVFQVIHYQGTAKALENQLDLRWVKPEQLAEFSFPAANQPIISNFIIQ